MQHRNFIWRWLIRAAWGVTGVVLTAVYLYYLRAQALPDLQFWHQQDLAAAVVPEPENFRNMSLDDYLAHEENMFSKLDATIVQIAADVPGWHRYGATAYSIYRQGWPEGNRSQLRTPEYKRGVAVLVHGLSDSTHSMRAVAGSLYTEGYETLNLRMPGHGTLPGALLNTRWQQFRGATRLGVQAMDQRRDASQPLILVGYSNGAALAVDYTVDALRSGGDMPVPQLLVLLSPAIRVAPVAAYANIQRWFSELPGMEKLGWTDVVAEFDPFKYNSFPVKAGEEIYQLTSRLQRRLNTLTQEQRQRFPRVIAFQSVLDSTIPADGVVSGLLDKLADTPAEMVYFDINRNASLLPLLVDSGRPLLQALSSRPELGFDLTIVGNANDYSTEVSARTRRRGEVTWSEQATDLHWPRDVYSLSHVALPFTVDDPIYGINGQGATATVSEIWLKGEQGGLAIPLALLARQRFNPFFAYLEERMLAAVAAVTPSATPSATPSGPTTATPARRQD
ncbi:hypothetical protein F0M18_14495 [Pseudohalioglobus sediminis]|uniref:Serine aminopeptidase S33 domain-containing protein n=1 Tax=Pseudohalioglobus sediminis TaxID=2606449 RepID=A0A5B0WRA4_9GAMM|nr:alpha/beta fold hydrolase [Pseudohalioglobus sediminis]KAA1189562.1 hypothetical protein F0M18_14495 [Pseudohalioglobus sediminis]